MIARCHETAAGSFRWRIRFDISLAPDITIVARMNGENRDVLDYYLFPRLDLAAPHLRLAEDNGALLDTYRFETLDAFFALAARTLLLEVA